MTTGVNECIAIRLADSMSKANWQQWRESLTYQIVGKELK